MHTDEHGYIHAAAKAVGGHPNQRRPVYIRVHLWFQYLAYFLALKQTSWARLSFTLLP
jgi:hypothetical protein